MIYKLVQRVKAHSEAEANHLLGSVRTSTATTPPMISMTTLP